MSPDELETGMMANVHAEHYFGHNKNRLARTVRMLHKAARRVFKKADLDGSGALDAAE